MGLQPMCIFACAAWSWGNVLGGWMGMITLITCELGGDWGMIGGWSGDDGGWLVPTSSRSFGIEGRLGARTATGEQSTAVPGFLPRACRVSWNLPRFHAQSIGGLNRSEMSKSMTTGICLLCFYHGKFTVSNRSIIHKWASFIHFPYITRGCTSKITGTVRRSTAARLVARTSCNLGWPTGLPRSAGLRQKTCWDIRSSLGCVSNHGSTWITWNFRTRTLRYYTSTM